MRDFVLETHGYADAIDELRRAIADLEVHMSALEGALVGSARPLSEVASGTHHVEIRTKTRDCIVRCLDDVAYTGGSNARGCAPRLSKRECEVLRCFCRGCTVSETAGALGLNVNTVSTYRVRLLHKLGFSNTAQLIAYGIRHRFD